MTSMHTQATHDIKVFFCSTQVTRFRMNRTNSGWWGKGNSMSG
jgi:hypothetical protein